MMESILLITPELKPDKKTIKRGLLRAQRISVIVPQEWEGVPSELQQHPEVWVPTKISDHMSDKTELFERTIAEASSVIAKFPQLNPNSTNRDRLLKSKFPYELESLMAHRGLIQKSSEEPGVYDVAHKDLLPTVLAIFGRNIANEHKEDGWVCSFGTTINARRAISADHSNPAGNIDAALLRLYEVPEPHPDATITDIITFRQDNRRLFESYFRSINEVRNLLEGESGDSGSLTLALNDGILQSDRKLAQIRNIGAPFAEISEGVRNPVTMVAAGTGAATTLSEIISEGNISTQVVSLVGLLAGAVVEIRRGLTGSAYLRKAATARMLAPI